VDGAEIEELKAQLAARDADLAGVLGPSAEEVR